MTPAAAGATRAGLPRLHPDLLAAVLVGGCAGGWARHAAVDTWAAGPGGFPSAVLAVNLAGALLLGVVVVAAEARPRRWLRPLLGTGFCGALTTFSAVVVDTLRLAGDGRVLLAGGYLAASALGGLAAGTAGLALARWLLAARPPTGVSGVGHDPGDERP